MRGTRRFMVKGKLAPRYVGPFKIVDRKGEVTYQLKKCLRVPKEQLPMEELDLGGDLTYSERPVKILDAAERASHHTEDEATWEHEEELRADYPELFPSAS
jgi:hypothetical protein